LVGTCCSTFDDWNKSENTGSGKLTSTWNVKITHALIETTYNIGDQVLLRKDGILRKSESQYESDPWTITSVHTDGTIRVQSGTKSE
jgi:hypothetical protein